MSILKSIYAGSKAIRVTCEQPILDEIAKLGYTYNYTLRCWSCRKNPLPDILIGHTYGWDLFYIYVNLTKYDTYTNNFLTFLRNLFLEGLKHLVPLTVGRL